MKEDEFNEKLRTSPRPVIVDFWAPWCIPCRAIAPVLEKLGEEYSGRVDVWKINADLEPEILRSLHLFGIPTLIAYHNGQEVGRRTGAASAATLATLFESALSGRKPERSQPAVVDRLLRLGAGFALIGLAMLGGLSCMRWILAGVGALIMFTAVYDRCPIYRMITTQLKETFRQNSAKSSIK
jgi:thioredoxin